MIPIINNNVQETVDLLKLVTPKFCIKCSHLLGNRNYPENSSNWNCGSSLNVNGEFTNLVNGLTYKLYIFKYCSEARASQSGCGNEGKWYEEYKKPEFLQSEESISNALIKKSKVRVTEDDLANL